MGRYLPLSTSIVGLGRVAPYLPFSMFLFLRSSQPRFVNVRKLKASCSSEQYADDATSILKSEESLLRMLDVVHHLELGSGAKLNTSRSEAMWLGRCRGDSPFGLKWVSKICILGVFFSNGLVSVTDDDWNVKLNKLSSVLGLWKQRNLSFIGRLLIVNVLGASPLWHVAT